MEQEDAPDPESTREKRMQSRLNALFAKAVAVCGVPPTAAASSGPGLATSGFQLAEKKGKKNWAALPAVDEWYKAAEKHATFREGKKAGDDLEVCLLDVKVEGLTPTSWVCPQVEPNLLAVKDRPK